MTSILAEVQRKHTASTTYPFRYNEVPHVIGRRIAC